MAKRDFYEILGVSKTADDATIKSAYKKVAKKYHPDLNPGDKVAEEKFKEAAEAYSILSDPQKKSMYDRGGYDAVNNGGYSSGGFSNMGDMFGDMFGGGFGDVFGNMFGGGGGARRSNRGPAKGATVQISITINFEEAVFGCKKDIEFTMKDSCPKCKGTGAKDDSSIVTCSKCNGSGQVVRTQQTMLGMMQNVTVCPDCRGSGKIIKEKCTECKGTGTIPTKQKISVDIPAGISSDEGIVMRGNGEPGKNGGAKGDLNIYVKVRPHAVFERDGYDLHSTEKMSFSAAVLGGKISVRTLDGPMNYSITAGMQSGTKVKFKGKGVPILRTGGKSRGDLYVTFVVDVPTKVNSAQKKLLKEYENTLN